jgi:hypothetical protein
MVYWQLCTPINTFHDSLVVPSIPHLFSFSLLLTLSHSFYSRYPFYLFSLIMITRASNKSKHPAKSVMTTAQLAQAGVSLPGLKIRPPKKMTKDQRIAALEESLRITRELLQTVPSPLLHPGPIH